MMSGPASLTLEPGAVLAGKYRIERILGQGGMGIVAAAYHLQLEQRVALKLMLPHAATSGEAVARFLREARAAARISSDHVVRVFDVGSLQTGEPYIAMEYLEGLDVAQLLTRQGRLAADEAIDFLLQACEALAEAHAAGIVHRDLKPGNLFLAHRVDGQRLIKVLDFGISKMTGPTSGSDAPATRTSALMGSPLYMSPEQMGSSKAVDARSDVWALGVVLYEMLCGQPPFNGETLPQVCAMVMTEEPPPLAARAPGLPPVLYEVVRRCLEKQPAARFQSVAQIAEALGPLASPRARQSIDRILRVQGVTPSGKPAVERVSTTPAVSAPITGAAAVATSQPQAGTYAPLSETRAPPLSRRSTLPVALGAVMVALIAGGVWFAQRSSETASAAADASSSAPLPANSPVAQPAPELAPPAAASAPPLPATSSPAPLEALGAPATGEGTKAMAAPGTPSRKAKVGASGVKAVAPKPEPTKLEAKATQPPAPAAVAPPAASPATRPAPVTTRSRL